MFHALFSFSYNLSRFKFLENSFRDAVSSALQTNRNSFVLNWLTRGMLGKYTYITICTIYLCAVNICTVTFK